jgi:hypothetical protein
MRWGTALLLRIDVAFWQNRLFVYPTVYPGASFSPAPLAKKLKNPLHRRRRRNFLTVCCSLTGVSGHHLGKSRHHLGKSRHGQIPSPSAGLWVYFGGLTIYWAALASSRRQVQAPKRRRRNSTGSRASCQHVITTDPYWCQIVELSVQVMLVRLGWLLRAQQIAANDRQKPLDDNKSHSND